MTDKQKRERAESAARENLKLIKQSKTYTGITGLGWQNRISGVGRIQLETCFFCFCPKRSKKWTLEVNVSSGKHDGEWKCSYCRAHGSTLRELTERKDREPSGFAWLTKTKTTRRTGTTPPVVHVDPATVEPITPTPAEQYAARQREDWIIDMIFQKQK